MEILIYSLLAVGAVLLLLSYRGSKGSNVEVQLENISIQLMKEMYQIKDELKGMEKKLSNNQK